MTTVADRPTTAAVPAFARGPVLAVAAGVGALLTAVSGRYGYFGDELYFVAAGRHLDWGYADQPPLLPLIAGAMDTLAPGSLMALRAPATLLTMLGIVLAALLARELGGVRKAQLLAAAAYVASPVLLGGGHLLATSTVDPALWTAVTFLVVRWVRTRDDRLLLGAGVVTAVALQAKFLIVAFWLVAIVAVLAVGPREMLRRPLLWVGGAVAVAATVPTLLWQAANGWPQLEMGRVIAAEGVYTGGMVGFLPLALVATGLLGGSVLAVYGLVRLLRAPQLCPYRFLAWTALGVTAVFLLSGGRVYYVAGMFPVLWAAGAAELGRRRVARWWGWIPTLPVFAVTLAFLLATNVLPIAPIEAQAGKPLEIGNFQRDEFGWPAYVDDVAAAYRALPPEQAARTAVLGGSYWSAAALDFYGPERGLPRAYGAHRGYAWFGVPGDDATSVLIMGEPGALGAGFATARQVGVADNDAAVNNLSQGTPIWLLEGRTQDWPELWARVRSL